MCGIVGYTGAWNAAPVLLSGLSRLEYRGYDSAGIAVSDVRDGENRIEVLKAKGRLQALKEMTDNGNAVNGTCGIGHTRWATHGEPSVANAHPHCSKDKRIVVVHNGIIENYKELKEYLQKKGVELIFGYQCSNILLEGAECKGVVIDNGHQTREIRGTHTIIATGRRGADWLEKLCAEHDIAHQPEPWTSVSGWKCATKL